MFKVLQHDLSLNKQWYYHNKRETILIKTMKQRALTQFTRSLSHYSI